MKLIGKMAKSFQAKKQEVFSYIDKLAEQKSWIELSSKKIHKKYDGIFGKKTVENILEGLLEEGSLEEDKIGYTIYYPKDDKKKISKVIKSLTKKNIKGIYFLVGLAWFLLLGYYPSLLNLMIRDTKDNLQIFFGGFLYSLLAIYAISQFINIVYLWIKEKNLVIKEKKKIITMVIGGLVIIATVFFFQFYYPDHTFLGTGIITILVLIIGYIINKQ